MKQYGRQIGKRGQEKVNEIELIKQANDWIWKSYNLMPSSWIIAMKNWKMVNTLSSLV